MGICAYEARRTQAIRAWVGPEARGLFVPVVAELDASVQRLHSVSALAAPVDVVADVHAAYRAFLRKRCRINIVGYPGRVVESVPQGGLQRQRR